MNTYPPTTTPTATPTKAPTFPTPAPTMIPQILSRTIVFEHITAAEYTGELKRTFEAGFAIAIGLYNITAAALNTGATLDSRVSNLSHRRGQTQSTSIVFQAIAQGFTSADARAPILATKSLTANAMVAGIVQAKGVLGTSVDVPMAASVRVVPLPTAAALGLDWTPTICAAIGFIAMISAMCCRPELWTSMLTLQLSGRILLAEMLELASMLVAIVILTVEGCDATLAWIMVAPFLLQGVNTFFVIVLHVHGMESYSADQLTTAWQVLIGCDAVEIGCMVALNSFCDKPWEAVGLVIFLMLGIVVEFGSFKDLIKHVEQPQVRAVAVRNTQATCGNGLGKIVWGELPPPYMDPPESVV